MMRKEELGAESGRVVALELQPGLVTWIDAMLAAV